MEDVPAPDAAAGASQIPQKQEGERSGCIFKVISSVSEAGDGSFALKIV